MSGRSSPFRVSGSTILLLASTLVAGCGKAPTPPPPAVLSDPAVEKIAGAFGRFAGSGSCRACHAAEYVAWERSRHHLTLRALDEGDLPTWMSDALRDGWELSDSDALVGTDRKGGRTRSRPAYLVGGRHREDLWLRLPNGNLQIYPYSWDADRKRVFSLVEEAAGSAAPPDSIDFWERSGRSADLVCYGCHATGQILRIAGDAEGRVYPVSAWRESGVGCEACHGPSGAHVDSGGASPVPTPSPSPDVCGGCHALRELLDAPFGSRPGHRYGLRLGDQADPVVRVPANLEFRSATFSDLRPATYQQEAVGLSQSGCAREGKLGCGACHDPHGGTLVLAAADEDGVRICATCHAPLTSDVRAHAGHAPGTPGGRCFDCHMAPILRGPASAPARDHSLAPPGAPSGSVPAACARCHAGKDADRVVAAWSSRTLSGKGALRRRRLEEAVGAAERGDPGASLLAARLAADGGESWIVRQEAAGLAGGAARSGNAREIVAALSVALDAEEPALRRAAARALGRFPLGASAGRLTEMASGGDPYLALEAALSLAAAGETAGVPRVVELQRRPELVGNPRVHFMLGRYALQAKEWEKARESLRRAVEGNPFYVPAWNDLGIASSGAGDVALAQECWRTALWIDPRFLPAKKNLEDSGGKAP